MSIGGVESVSKRLPGQIGAGSWLEGIEYMSCAGTGLVSSPMLACS